MSETAMRWTVRHDRAILALLQEDNERDACRRARISRATMTRYKRWPLFQERLQREQREMFDAAKRKLLAASAEAVATLTIASSGDAHRVPWTSRVQAARTLLALCVRIDENENILDRLELLERGVAADPEGEIVQ